MLKLTGKSLWWVKDKHKDHQIGQGLTKKLSQARKTNRSIGEGSQQVEGMWEGKG